MVLNGFWTISTLLLIYVLWRVDAVVYIFYPWLNNILLIPRFLWHFQCFKIIYDLQICLKYHHQILIISFFSSKFSVKFYLLFGSCQSTDLWFFNEKKLFSVKFSQFFCRKKEEESVETYLRKLKPRREEEGKTFWSGSQSSLEL